jgi:hypothetical protein
MAKNAVAFFAGLGSGYLQQKDRDEERARRDKRDAREQEQHDATMAAHRKGQAADAAVVGASRPMVAGAGGMSKPDTMDNRDVGLPENAALPNGGLADSATANTPQAVRGRQVAALQGIDPERADRLQLSGKQAELTDLQLKDKKDTLTREDAFREATKLIATGGWSAVPQVYARYEDGFTAQVQEDGKGGATITRLNKDGKPVGSKTFGDLQEFILGQVAHIDPKLWVSETRLAAQAKADQANKDRDFGQRKTEFETNKDLQRQQLGISAGHLQIARDADKRAAASAGVVTAKDLEDASKTIATRMTEIYQPKDGMTPQERDVLGKQRDKAATEAHGIYRINNLAGNVVDTNTAIWAARLAADPKNLMQRTASDGRSFPGVMVNGNFVVTGPALIAKPAAAKQPAAAAAPAPRAAAPAPVDRIGDQPIGPLTRMGDIQESALAGNPRAIAWLEQRAAAKAENATAPRTAAAMLGVQ